MTELGAIDWMAGLTRHDQGLEPMRIGDEAHKELFCRALLETHDPYKPAVIDWPRLSDEARNRLVSLPIWNIAVQTEGKASRRVLAYADLVAGDDWLRRAVELNAFEEARHKQVLSNLVEAYGIALAPEPDYPPLRDIERAFMVAGFSECIDSFFAFGLFELGRRSGFFPAELVDTFEPVIHEEARHILFFVNWAAWRRAHTSWWKRPWFEARVIGVWLFLAWERLGFAKGIGEEMPADSNFTVTGVSAVGIDVTLGQMIDICLAENDRRLGPYDKRLLRPRFVPALARFARRFMR